jgi:hypothetical protein
MTKGSGKGDNKSRKQGWRNKKRDGELRTFGNNDRNSKNLKNKDPLHKRPKWTPVKLLTDPIPTPVCPYCNKSIKELAQAFTDKNSGEAIHFDCVRERLANSQILEKGENITYIGGGRFGVVYLAIPNSMRTFKIKKIIEWENKDERAVWRGNIADHFSLT